ncbi:hypothetical protein VPHF99_0029 [Vibrio phage F99]|nr:hypothetical protein MYOV056v2_p0027 [Vibrio phage 184E37.3a]QZI87122.1 hypothetical protein MYOV085v1_p0103 [Vibrio phage 355E48.1]QZI90028.1 hypothetical protein MYOV057v1_p0113 [Vibrio phage 184E37.1]
MKVLTWEEKAAEIWNKYCNNLSNIYEQEQLDALWREEDIPEFSTPESIMDYLFGHIVWADYNYESWHIEWCIGQKDSEDYDEMLDFEKELLVKSLQELLENLPKYEECEDYEGL